MIKKIQSETGAKVQFKQGKYTCTLSFISPFQKISVREFCIFFFIKFSPKLNEVFQLQVFFEKNSLHREHFTLWEHSGSVIECSTRDGRAPGSSLTGVTVLCL